MTLKTGRKCKWEEIKAGEVFACDAKLIGWIVIFKISRKDAMDLCQSDTWMLQEEPGEVFEWADFDDKLYKLPLSTQRLWKEE